MTVLFGLGPLRLPPTCQLAILFADIDVKNAPPLQSLMLTIDVLAENPATVLPPPSLRTTLLFLLDRASRELVLARKLSGFGAGKINAPGGKAGWYESLKDAARRETQEEIGVLPPAKHTRCVGALEFRFPHQPRADQHCFVYVCDRGWNRDELRASTEMAPQIVSMDAIPYPEMWPDDELWLPRVLAGENNVFYSFSFDEKGAIFAQAEKKEDDFRVSRYGSGEDQ